MKKSVVIKIFVAIAVLSLVTVVAIVAFVSQKTSSQTFLIIDGNKVDEKEYRCAMFSARDDILAQMNQSGDPKLIWNAQTDIGVPYEMVAERAIQILREYYAVNSLAVEYGYLESAGFGTLTEQLKRENEYRAAAIAAGELVTGLTSYDFDQYIQYRMDAIRRQYCQDAGNPGMAISETELRQQYEQDKGSLYTQADDLDLSYIEIDTNAMELSEQELLELEAEVELLRQEAVECGSLQEALTQFPNLRQYCATLAIGGNEYAAYAKSYAALLCYADGLQTGDISDLISEYGTIFLIECTKRVKNDYVPIESLTSVLEQSVRNHRYDCMIQERILQLKVEYDAEKLYQYTEEQLR